jgi:hypothetical protein
MIYALVDQQNTVLRVEPHALRPADPVGKGWRWLPVEDTDPPFDGAMQKRTGPVVTVAPDRVTRVWTVADKTAQELSDEQDAEAVGAVDGMKALRALVKWVAPLVGKTPAQARSEIVAVLKSMT